MSNEAWNKVKQTHELFKKIISPLKQHLRLNFGYMIVFNDGRYYQIIEDLDCLKKWVTNVETSHIFCARNVTNYFDGDYNFTIWPEEPTCSAMDIYKEYGIWNGITVSKINKNYTELYWFTKENAEDGWHRWFIRNKPIIHKFIKYFDKSKEQLRLLKSSANLELFVFNKLFKIELQKSECAKEESFSINKLNFLLESDVNLIEDLQNKTPLSQREIEVLHALAHGYTVKLIAAKLHISFNTAKCYVDRIKAKTGLHYKTDLIKIYETLFLKPNQHQ